MYKRKGKIFNSQDTNAEGEHFLQTEEGKVYKVSETVMYVWERLDGDMSLDQLNASIIAAAGIEPKALDKISENIVHQLQKIDLVAQV